LVSQFISMETFKAELFVDDMEIFKCSICLQVLNDPHQCPKGHLYCRNCIMKWIERKNRCPLCKCDLTIATLSASLICKQVIHERKVKCPTTLANQTEGLNVCDWTGKFKEVDAHHAQCGFGLTACGNDGCGMHIAKNSVAAHDVDCEFKLLSCDLCTQVTKRRSQAEHLTSSCPRRRVDCPNACGATIPFEEIKKHRKICSLELTICPNKWTREGCVPRCPGRFHRKDIEVHFCSNEIKLTALKNYAAKIECLEVEKEFLQEENKSLKRKADKLKADVECHDLMRSWEKLGDSDINEAMETQLQQKKSRLGEVWTTHHIAHEFTDVDFTGSEDEDEENCGVLESTMQYLIDNVKGCIKLIRNEDDDIGCYLRLEGFRGSAEFTITVFRIDRGLPGQFTATNTWSKDSDYGWESIFSLNELETEGYISGDNKIRILATVHLEKH